MLETAVVRCGLSVADAIAAATPIAPVVRKASVAVSRSQAAFAPVSDAIGAHKAVDGYTDAKTTLLMMSSVRSRLSFLDVNATRRSRWRRDCARRAPRGPRMPAAGGR
jgi:hypothetical protein